MGETGPVEAALDDASAIAALQRRDEAGVAQLVTAWTPSMLRLARAHTSCDASAEDAVQDAWVTVLSQIERFESRSALRTWVLGIVINTARRAGGRERRTIPFSATSRAERDDERAPAVDPARFHARAGHWASPPLRWDLLPEEQLTAGELRGVIDTALAALPGRQRAVMIARDVLGLSGEEVGELYELSDGNQRVLLHRARSKVRPPSKPTPPSAPGSRARHRPNRGWCGATRRLSAAHAALARANRSCAGSSSSS